MTSNNKVRVCKKCLGKAENKTTQSPDYQEEEKLHHNLMYSEEEFVEEEYKHELIDTYPNINTIMTQINIDTKEDIQNSEEVRIYGEVG